MSDDLERDEFEPEQQPEPGPAGREARPARAGHEADEYVYVDDPVSKWWVIGMVAVFVAIVLYGLLLGRAGMLNPRPTPSPSPMPSPSPTMTAPPSASASPVSPSPMVSPPASPSAS